jgi:hypothetical protein
MTLYAKLAAPYLFLTFLRAVFRIRWKPTDRAAVYFCLMVILVAVGGWYLWVAWDLFYLMYALGDMPAEIKQFFQLEGAGLAVGLGAIVLAAVCLKASIRLMRQN